MTLGLRHGLRRALLVLNRVFGERTLQKRVQSCCEIMGCDLGVVSNSDSGITVGGVSCFLKKRHVLASESYPLL